MNFLVGAYLAAVVGIILASLIAGTRYRRHGRPRWAGDPVRRDASGPAPLSEASVKAIVVQTVHELGRPSVIQVPTTDRAVLLANLLEASARLHSPLLANEGEMMETPHWRDSGLQKLEEFANREEV